MLFGNGTTLGLDLGATGFRAVELAPQGERPTVDRWAAMDFPTEVTDWDQANRQELAATIRRQALHRGLRARWVSHSVSGENVAPQYFNFPQLMPEDVAEAVRLEVEAALPFNASNAMISYLLFPEQRLGTGKVRTHGIAIAADSAYVEDRLNVLRNAQLEPFCVETDSTACANAYLATRRLPDQGATAILNIGRRYTNLALLGTEGTLLVRDLPWAGGQLTDAIAQVLGVPAPEAEEQKRKGWEEGPKGALAARMPEVLEATAREFAISLRDTIEYWSAERLVPALSHIAITGGGSQVHGLPEFLADIFMVPVERWSPMSQTPGGAEEFRPWTYRMTVAFGLALRTFGRKTS